MPFKSEAQRRKFYELEKQGKMSSKTVQEFQAATGNQKLPERVTPKAKEAKPKPAKVWFAKVIK